MCWTLWNTRHRKFDLPKIANKVEATSQQFILISRICSSKEWNLGTVILDRRKTIVNEFSLPNVYISLRIPLLSISKKDMCWVIIYCTFWREKLSRVNWGQIALFVFHRLRLKFMRTELTSLLDCLLS